jgi:hypothetical protein
MFRPNRPHHRPYEGSSTRVEAELAPSPESQAVREGLAALLATGASREEALGLAALAHGNAAVLPILQESLRRPNGSPQGSVRVQGILRRVAAANPGLAQEALLAWGHNRRTKNDLTLADAPWLETLPDGLASQKTMRLNGLAIRALPQRLEVSILSIFGCPAWDGRIPEDARIGDRLFTERHRTGISLERWRVQHPEGELCPEVGDPAMASGGNDA